MPRGIAHALERQPTQALLDHDLRAFVALAVRATQNPQQLSASEVAAAAAAARSPLEYLDAVGVIIGFNFVTRVANALGVDPDLAPWLRRVDPIRRLAVALVVLGLRWLVDLRPRRFAVRPAAATLSALGRLFADAGLDALPEPFLQLVAAPHLLDVQRELLEALLGSGGARPAVERELFLTTGLVVLHEIGAPRLFEQVARALRRRWSASPERILVRATSTPPPGADLAALVPPFARDVTLWSYRITPKRIGVLRDTLLDDARILDLVSAIALWNACGRLEKLLAGQPIPAELVQAAGLPLAEPR